MALELVAALWAAGTMSTHGRPGDPNTRLMVLGVLDASGRLAGIAPWYLQRGRPGLGAALAGQR